MVRISRVRIRLGLGLRLVGRALVGLWLVGLGLVKLQNSEPQ